MATKPKAPGAGIIQTLIEQFGEEEARRVCLAFFRDPTNLENWALIFPDYVPTELGQFHGELLDLYLIEEGNAAAAAPRGFSKSTVTDLIFLSWALLFGYKRFVILVSDTHDQAVMLLEALKSELETNEIIRWLFGNVDAGSEWSSEGLVVRGIDEDGNYIESKVMAKGAGKKIRGSRFKNFRPDLVLIDDLENDEAVESADRRIKLQNWLKKGVIPALAKDVGQIIMIGTVLHRDSLLNNILEGAEGFESWTTLHFAAIKEDGTSLWPERFDVTYLEGMRDDPKHPFYLGPVAFAQEMQNKPIAEGDRIIQPEWLMKRYSLTESVTEYMRQQGSDNRSAATQAWLKLKFRRIVGAVDPAISEKTTADFWAMVTIGIERNTGHIFILDIVRMREGDPLKQVKMVFDQYRQWGHDTIKVESVAYQKGLHALIQRQGAAIGLYPPVMPYRPDTDKTRRATFHSANFAGGLVWIRQDHPLLSPFVEEILAFPQGSHDDMFDAYMIAAEETVTRVRARTFSKKAGVFK